MSRGPTVSHSLNCCLSPRELRSTPGTLCFLVLTFLVLALIFAERLVQLKYFLLRTLKGREPRRCSIRVTEGRRSPFARVQSWTMPQGPPVGKGFVVNLMFIR